MITPTTVTLQEVFDILREKELFIAPQKVEKFYDLIDDHSYLCVREPESVWLCNYDDDDMRMACNEITDILELDHSIIDEYYMVVASTIEAAAFELGPLIQRHKVAFYIAVLAQLLPED